MERSWKELEQIIDSSPAMIWITDKEGSCTYLSQQWFNYTGQSQNQALDLGWLDAIHRDDVERVAKKFKEANNAQRAFTLEYRLRTKAGVYRWVTDAGNPRLNDDKVFIGFVGTVFDIHEQKLSAKEASLKSEAIENSLNGFDIVNSRGEFVYANSAYLKMWRYESLDELIQSRPEDHCLDPEVPRLIIEELKKNGKCNIEFVAKRKDGTTFDVLMWARLALDADGNEIYPTTSIDISTRKKAERQIKESEQTLSLITNSIPDLIGYVDKDYTYKFANSAYEKKMGVKTKDIIGQSIAALWPEYFKRIKPSIDKALSGENVHIQTSISDITGENFIFDIKYIPDFDSSRKVSGFVVIGHDVTDLIRAKESAEKANRLKSSFLANMSHEIRTPLSAMLGFTELLKDPHLTPTEKDNFLNIMSKNGEQLSVIINDILDLSKVEAGHLNYDFQRVDIKNLIEELINFMSIKARDKRLILRYEIDKKVPRTINTDPIRVRQILLNLIGNSIKFTAKGEIQVKVFARTRGKKRKLYFEVTDTGIGIAKGKTESIFDVFVQADDSTTRKFGGTGLGLALSRRLAKALGGNIRLLNSEEDKGTTMVLQVLDQPENRLSLPSKQLKSIEKPVSLDVFKKAKILVVDDVPDNQVLIAHYLKSTGVEMEFVSNGREAFDSAIKNDYDLILMDIQMPEMDGYTATSQLRIAGYNKPIIALTAHAMTEAKEKCLSVGCSDYLAKPIKNDELKKLVGHYLSSRESLQF